jgi:hypothetical protein
MGTTTTNNSVTIRSEANNEDARAIPPIQESYKLDALRQKAGTWMKPEDVFLNPLKVAIERDSESEWSVGDVWQLQSGQKNAVVLIRRAVQIVEIKIKRGGSGGSTPGSDVELAPVRLAPNAKLKEVRGRLEARGDMAAEDAFVEPDGREQVPMREEETRSVQSALTKEKALLITSRADWG